MLGWLFGFSLLSSIVAGAYFWTEAPLQWKDQLLEWLPSYEVSCLEVRYSPEQVLQKHQAKVCENGCSYDEASLELYPYLLMDVKYLKGTSSYEGKLLWSLTDGEIVLNTRAWQTSHGYDDCLMAHTSREEMRIINALSQHGGQLDRQRLLEYLKHDSAHVDQWLEKCHKKQLIIQTGNLWKLHMQNPNFCIEPVTQIKETLVQRSLSGAKIMNGRYRISQITELAKAAFGSDFAIKRSQEIYIPIYCLNFKHADGSRSTMRVNAYSSSLF